MSNDSATAESVARSSLDFPEGEWAKEQLRMAALIQAHDDRDWSAIRLVAGVDTAVRAGDGGTYVAVAVFAFPHLQLVHSAVKRVVLDAPYASGFLGFRECDSFAALLAAVPREFTPDVVLVDGNGMLHPRGCGSASHLGLLTGLATVGIGKTLHEFDGLTARACKVPPAWTSSDDDSGGERRSDSRSGGGDHGENGGSGGDGGGDGGGGGGKCGGADSGTLASWPLVGTSGRTQGACVLSGASRNPVFVSVGHRVSLETAVRLVHACSRVRQPEPIRAADALARGNAFMPFGT